MQEILESLCQLGFKKNDAKVYLALLQLEKSNPSVVSKKTNIVRARVYDSLKRLEKQGFIEREAVNRAPEYFATNPDIVFSNIKKELTEKINITDQIPDVLKEKIKIKPKKETWAIRGINRIKSKIENIISQANKKLSVLITPDYTKNSEKWIYELLLSQAQTKIEMNVGMKINEDNMPEVKELLKNGIKISHWQLTEEMPIGLYTSDSKNTLITIIGRWEKYYQHDVGFIIQGPPAHHKGFEFLIQWFLSSCKRADEVINKLE